jgi:hypothetical protein
MKLMLLRRPKPTRESSRQKKKEGYSSSGEESQLVQAALFEEPEKQINTVRQGDKKARQKVEQASLFSESQGEKEEEVDNRQAAAGTATAEVKQSPENKSNQANDPSGGKAFGVGETIELEL